MCSGRVESSRVESGRVESSRVGSSVIKTGRMGVDDKLTGKEKGEVRKLEYFGILVGLVQCGRLGRSWGLGEARKAWCRAE